MKSEENKIRWTISIDPDLARRIDELAAARLEARSECIERIILHEIDSEEKFVRMMEDPIHRALVSVLFSSPKLVETLAAAVGQKLDGLETVEKFKKHRARGKQRAALKKSQAQAKSE